MICNVPVCDSDIDKPIVIVPTSNTLGKEYVGTSETDKPMNVQQYSIYHELDTGKDYYYDGGEWNEIPNSGGGGGTMSPLIVEMIGDYPSTSSVTFGEIYNAFMDGQNVALHVVEQEEEGAGTYYPLSSLQIYASVGEDETVNYTAYLGFSGNQIATPQSATSVEGLFPMYLGYTD